MQALARPARFSSADEIVPNPTALAVVTTLADFAIITFAVDPDALAQLLPDGFEPDVCTMSDGTKSALVSAVTFRDLDFRLCAMPWPKFSFGQTNYRAYAIHKGQRVAWFFGTSLATPFVLIPIYGWQLPWHHATMDFNTTWQAEKCLTYDLATTGAWGTAHVILEGTDEVAGVFDGFYDDEDMAVILTHPLQGFYRRRDGRIGTYSVWHEKLSMHRGIAKTASFEVFENLGLCESGAKPHSVLIQESTEFVIMLPPRMYGV